MTGASGPAKALLVLARRDPTEAMRVAAGLTVLGHAVRIVFMSGPLADDERNAAMVELLELAGVAPLTTVPEMGDELPLLDAAGLAEAIGAADAVVSL